MKSITLVGFMGAGKTTAGKELARLLDIPFKDLDDEIEQREGKSIADIFIEHGERYFRSKEWDVLFRLERGDRVLSIGGGAFTIDDNINLIKSRSKTVWLDCPIEICLERCAHAKSKRPVLSDPVEMAHLYKHRLAYYRRAEFKVDSSTGTPIEIAMKIIETLELTGHIKKH